MMHSAAMEAAPARATTASGRTRASLSSPVWVSTLPIDPLGVKVLPPGCVGCVGCTGAGGSAYVFVNASTSASPATVAFKWPRPSSTTVTVTLYACLSYVTFACASSSSVSANSYVPGLSNVSAGKAILPSAAFFAFSSVPSAAV